MSGEPRRTRRRRRLAAALRAVSTGAATPALGVRHGPVGKRILELAGRSGVTLFPDSDLAEVLARLDTGETIPPEVALAIATVLLPVLNARGR